MLLKDVDSDETIYMDCHSPCAVVDIIPPDSRHMVYKRTNPVCKQYIRSSGRYPPVLPKVLER